jgi:hypothetical protein
MACASLFAGFCPDLSADLLYEIELTEATRGFDGKMRWFHARAGAIPPNLPVNPSDEPLVVMTLQKLQISGLDVFFALNEMRSADLGSTWTAPGSTPPLPGNRFPGRGSKILRSPFATSGRSGPPVPGSCSESGTPLSIRIRGVMKVRPRGTAYSV